MLRLKKDTSPDANVTSNADADVTPVVVDTDATPIADDDTAAPDGIALQKKGLPPAALIGIAVGALALAGLAAYLLMRPTDEPENTAVVATPGVVRAPGRPTRVANSATTVVIARKPGGAISNKPVVVVAPGGAPRVAVSPVKRPAAAGIATIPPPPVPVVSAAVVRPGPGAPPTLAPPSAPVRPLMTPLTPALKAQLNVLWQRGADAKHRGDYLAARLYWKKALTLRPGHPGFAQAIRKLPTRQGRRVR